jgi:Fuc2NAc and GlcNAc transferase
MVATFVLPLAAALIALACCLLVIRYAQKWQLMDKPNHRSSHVTPTPGGGGVGVVLAGVLTGLCLVWFSGWTWILGATVIAVSSVLAAVGLIDDMRPMRASYRLWVQLIVSTALLFSMGGVPEFERFAYGYTGRMLLYPLLLLVILWWINLFNFMDGIDGLAGSQAGFMLLSGAGLLAWLNPAVMAHPMWLWMLCLSAAVIGFLLLNWPPAKIFMGDVGSVYLALMILSLGLMSIRYQWVSVPAGLGIWAILGAVFVSDATVTLLVRMATGQRWHEGHRSHLYQRLSRRWGSHQKVTALYITINVLWLLPLAVACVMWPKWVLVFILLAYCPLMAATYILGAGRPELTEKAA